MIDPERKLERANMRQQYKAVIRFLLTPENQDIFHRFMQPRQNYVNGIFRIVLTDEQNRRWDGLWRDLEETYVQHSGSSYDFYCRYIRQILKRLCRGEK